MAKLNVKRAFSFAFPDGKSVQFEPGLQEVPDEVMNHDFIKRDSADGAVILETDDGKTSVADAEQKVAEAQANLDRARQQASEEASKRVTEQAIEAEKETAGKTPAEILLAKRAKGAVRKVGVDPNADPSGPISPVDGSIVPGRGLGGTTPGGSGTASEVATARSAMTPNNPANVKK